MTWPSPPDQLVRQHRRCVAQPSRPLFHAAQRGTAQETQESLLSTPMTATSSWYPEVVGAARFEHVPTEVVVRGHDAHGLREPPQPLTQPVLRWRPSRAQDDAGRENGARAAPLLHLLDERVLALLGPAGGTRRRVAAIREGLEAAVEQVVGRHMCNGLTVRVEVRNHRLPDGPAAPAPERDRRQAGLSDAVDDRRIVDVGDDAVGVPCPLLGQPADPSACFVRRYRRCRNAGDGSPVDTPPRRS